jgi:hypothetical protein
VRLSHGSRNTRINFIDLTVLQLQRSSGRASGAMVFRLNSPIRRRPKHRTNDGITGALQ